MDPATGTTLVDSLGRRSYTTSIAFGPTIGKDGTLPLAYLPHAYCQVGRDLRIQYFADVYPVKVEAVGGTVPCMTRRTSSRGADSGRRGSRTTAAAPFQHASDLTQPE